MENQTLSLQLNQSNLQDFLDCPRRFELNVLQDKSWPAATARPLSAIEYSIHLGNRFHQICQQYFTGIPPSMIRKSLNDPDLLEMWDVFVPYADSLKDYQIYFEQLLIIPFMNHRLIAKFDLIVQLPEKYLIIDWKTSPKKPPLQVLSERVQTYLYPFIFSISGPDLFHTELIEPESIDLLYWYPLSSEPEVSFNYSLEEHQEVQIKLEEIIKQIEIHHLSKTDFPLTPDTNKCQFCSYRSLCDRGSSPGDFELFSDLDEIGMDDLIIDIEQVSELEF
jgi:hypothetical protein